MGLPDAASGEGRRTRLPNVAGFYAALEDKRPPLRGIRGAERGPGFQSVKIMAIKKAFRYSRRRE